VSCCCNTTATVTLLTVMLLCVSLWRGVPPLPLPLSSSSGASEALQELQHRMKGPLSADDPTLLNIIRDRYLTPPSTKPYNFSYSERGRNAYISSQLMNALVKNLFGSRRGGFFVEAGALDGEYMSHTIDLETKLGWRGLLVEPDEENFRVLQTKQRQAWSSRSCLATRGYPEMVVLRREVNPVLGSDMLNRGRGRIVKDAELSLTDSLYNALLTPAQCLPAASLLKALGVRRVDFFVLDVEQAERGVLEHFPFEEVLVDVWAIEHFTYHEDAEFTHFMVSKGYYYFDVLCSEVADYYFVRKGSELFAKMKVPLDKQNRTLICPYKEIIRRNTTYNSDADLIDPHHFPALEYRETPLVSPTQPDGTMILH